MELLQLLQKHIPQKKNIFAKFHKKDTQDISKFLLHMIKKIKKETKDMKLLNVFFIELYDILYQEILFDRVVIPKKFLRLFEELALPMKYIGNQKWAETLKKLMRLKL